MPEQKNKYKGKDKPTPGMQDIELAFELLTDEKKKEAHAKFMKANTTVNKENKKETINEINIPSFDFNKKQTNHNINQDNKELEIKNKEYDHEN